jgi:hypothetical protein
VRVKLRPVRPVPLHASWRPYRHEPWRRGYVSLVGHGKTWSGYLVGPGGEVLPLARRSLSAVLASWRTGREKLIDERLIGLIADVSDEFGGRPIRIVSGYREVSYAPDSKHKVGQAFDFSVPGVPNDALRDFLRSLPDVGVGYYPNSTHVHLDVRDKPTYWVDYSRPGDHPLYAYDRRVGGFSPRERALATALDALGALPATSRSAALATSAAPSAGSVRARPSAASPEAGPGLRAGSLVLPPTAAFPVADAAAPGAPEPSIARGDAGEDENEPAPAEPAGSAALVTR